jgi:hypothetical protein
VQPCKVVPPRNQFYFTAAVVPESHKVRLRNITKAYFHLSGNEHSLPLSLAWNSGKTEIVWSFAGDIDDTAEFVISKHSIADLTHPVGNIIGD